MCEDTLGCDCELCRSPAIDPLFLQAMERISALTEEKQQLSAKIEILCDKLARERRDYNQWARDWKEAKTEDIRKLNEKIKSQKIQAENLKVLHNATKVSLDKQAEKNTRFQASNRRLLGENERLYAEAACSSATTRKLQAENEKLLDEANKPRIPVLAAEDRINNLSKKNAELREENQVLQAELELELGAGREYDRLEQKMIMELRAKNAKLKKELNTEIAVVLHLDGWLTKRDDEVMLLEASLVNRQELIILLNEQNNEKNEKIKVLKGQLPPWCNRKECPFFPM